MRHFVRGGSKEEVGRERVHAVASSHPTSDPVTYGKERQSARGVICRLLKETPPKKLKDFRRTDPSYEVADHRTSISCCHMACGPA